MTVLLAAAGAPAGLTDGLLLLDGQRKTPPAGADGACSESLDAGTGKRLDLLLRA
jgi:hypothetical protein